MKQKYDFSWIDVVIKSWQPEFRKKENIRQSINMIPWKLTHWCDLSTAIVYTHLGEVVDYDYFKLKDEYIEKCVIKYGE